MRGLSVFILLSVFLSQGAHAVIYGADDRRDISQAPSWRNTARAVASAVGNNLIKDLGDGHAQINLVENLSSYMCDDEKFAQQRSLGVCTGFLISPKHLLTAGHCAFPTGIIDDLNHPFCQNFNWYFDYNDADGMPQPNSILKKNIYGCKNVIRAENIEGFTKRREFPGNDFALIELDREVEDIEPLKLSKVNPGLGELVFTIGHPMGMPAKFSGFSPVIANSMKAYFEVNLDTQGGNSGGPVFNRRGEVIGILVSGHPVDLKRDVRLRCERYNRCDPRGESCDQDSRFENLPTSNFIQRLDPLWPYLEKVVSPMTSN